MRLWTAAQFLSDLLHSNFRTVLIDLEVPGATRRALLFALACLPRGMLRPACPAGGLEGQYRLIV